MKRINSLLAMMVLGALAARGAMGSPGTEGVFLVRDGRVTSTIVLPAGASPAQREIAEYFSRIVEQSTGAKIPVVDPASADKMPADLVRVRVGMDEKRKAELPEEGYRITCRDNVVEILGNDASGAAGSARGKPASLPTLWAMDHMLEKGLGVRWLWPGDLGTYVPKCRDLFVPNQEVSYQPRLIQRKLRVPFSYVAKGGGTPAERKVEREALDWVEHHQAGRRGDFQFGHAFANWWERFSKTHPDYFMVPPPGVSLEKIPPQYMKLRLSNPAVIEQIARDYETAGAPKYWNVCPNDGSGFDTSEATRAWDIPPNPPVEDVWSGKADLTPRYVMFWNLLAERLRKINPDVVLCTYAYSTYKNPPPPERPVTAKLMVGLVLSFYDDALWLGWASTGAELFLRPNWWHAGANAPYLPLAETERFLKMAASHGMVGIDMDSLNGYWATQGLNYYLVARLMNNPGLSRQEIINEYTSAFGDGAGKIREYFDYWQNITTGYRYTAPDGKFQQLLAEGKVDKALTRASRQLLPYLYTDEILRPAYQLLDEAGALVSAEDQASRDRVNFLRDGLDEMKATRDLVETNNAIRSTPTAELKARFKSQSDALGKLRSRLDRTHAVWNGVVSKDEDRRSVFYVPRYEAPKAQETDEM